MERRWPLIGRHDELRTVAAAIRPGAAGVVVAGPAGVGKTRLARDATGGEASRGASVVWAQGSASVRSVPLGAFAGALDVSSGEPAETIGRALGRLARHRRLVVAVDDAHLLDEHSAIVLHRLVTRRLAPALVTIRAGEQTLDLVTSLWKDDHLRRVDLGPLTVTDTVELIAKVLGGPVDSASAQRLWTLSQGSPLFLRHLMAGEVAAGRFTPASGIWSWQHEPSISPELTSLVEQQIGRVPSGVQDVVDLVAVAEPVLVPSLVSLTTRTDLEEAENRGLVRTDGVSARLAHPLYGEVRRAAMGSLRARRLRGLVAKTLDAGTDPIHRAVLTLESDLPPEPGLYLDAARTAVRMYDLPLAERLARAAGATGEPQARLMHAAALSWLGRGREAESVLADLVQRAPDPETLALTQLHRAGNLVRTMARIDDARRALTAAKATGALPQLAAAMTMNLAASTGDLGPVLDGGPSLMRAAPADELARLVVASAVSGAAAVTGDAELLEEAAVAGGLDADRVPTSIPGFGLADLQVLGHRLAGRPTRAAVQASRIRAASAELLGPARLVGLLIVGHADLAAGRISDALTSLREAWAGLADSGHEARFRCRTLLATALAQAGRTAEAAPLLSAVAAEQHPVYRLYRPDDLLALAWGAAAEGSTTEALQQVTAAAELARQTGARAYEVLAWQTAVQLGDATAALARLTTLVTLGPRAEHALLHARAWTERDGDKLLEAAVGWDRLGDLLAAGDAAAQAADVDRGTGRRGSAAAAAAAAERLAARSGAWTPALAVAARPLPLTAREREIITLAARGSTNKAIAERLTLSIRTVEGHLYRAGHKLGVSERAGFADILRRSGGEAE